MKLKFTDVRDDIWFELHESLPPNRGKYKHNALNKVNMAALTLWGNYRKSIYGSFTSKPDLTQDIKDFNTNPVHIQNNRIIDPKDPLNNYSIYGTLLGIKKVTDNTGKCFIAYKNGPNGLPIKIGFASFIESTVNGKPVVYIADAFVRSEYMGKSIGRRLIQCIMANFPENTEFYILTRNFIHEAITLYRDRLKFDPISADEIKQLDYDNERYVGFKHRTTSAELKAINEQRKEITSNTAFQKKPNCRV